VCVCVCVCRGSRKATQLHKVFFNFFLVIT